MPRKPDRFERMVNQNFGVIVSTNPENAQYMYREDAVKLLRKEHAWVRRMVQSAYTIAEEMGLSKRGLKDLIVEQLTDRAK